MIAGSQARSTERRREVGALGLGFDRQLEQG